MQIEIIGFLLIVSLAFLVAGWILREQGESLILFLCGFIIVMLTGSIIAFSGIDFLNAIIVNNNSITTNVFATPTYVNALVSMIFILGGLWGTLTMSLAMAAVSKYKKYGEADQ